MRIPKSLKLFCVYGLSVMLTNAPQLAVAEAAPHLSMLSTNSVVTELTRHEAEARVQNILNNEDVKKQLMANGISADEASARLAALSEAEMKSLAGQLQEARAGGDILIAILVVVLIIFLIKRI